MKNLLFRVLLVFAFSIKNSVSLLQNASENIQGNDNSHECISYYKEPMVERLWPNATVTYEIDSIFTADEIARIETGWSDISDATCIQFKKRTVEHDYVVVSKWFNSSGCDSKIAREGGVQRIHYSTDCLNMRGRVSHEMLHTLGMLHEHSRQDRDLYVTILYDRIDPEYAYNFNCYDLKSIPTFGLPYNYDSVMHYSKNHSSIDGSPTIIPKISGIEIGQRNKVSDLDLERIRRMYKCKESKVKITPNNNEIN